MNIVDVQRRMEEVHQRLEGLGNQKEMLEALYQASQQLWTDDEVRSRCDQLMRDLAREIVKNAQRIWDLSTGEPEVPRGVGRTPDSLGADGLPF